MSPKAVILVAVCWLLTAFAATADTRVALVIGNSDYANAPRLANPVNDAAALADALGRIGFAVTRATDLDGQQMRAVLRDFRDVADGADVAIVFFAGHGIEVDMQNYLIPVDADVRNASDVLFDTVPLSLVNQAVSGARTLSMVVLDACRDNPFAVQVAATSGGATRGLQVGLSPVEPAAGTLVVYAARGGTVAIDGTGANSPFTTALLDHIEEPGLDVSLLFRKVRDDVMVATNNRQEPFTYGSLPGREIFLVPPGAANTRSDPSASASPAEEEAWRSARNSLDVAVLEEFVFAHPRGVYLEQALARLRELKAPVDLGVDLGALPAAPEPPMPIAPVAEPPPPAPSEPDPRELVATIQRELQRAGCSPGAADGDWGPRSRNALARFAGDTGVAVGNGLPSETLLAAIRASAKGCVAPPAAPPQTRAADVARPQSTSGCYDVAVTVMPYPTGEDWDPWPGNRALPDPRIAERSTGARAQCDDSWTCSMRVQNAGRQLSFHIEDADPDAPDPIGSGSCTAGSNCTVGLARLTTRAC